MSLHPFYESYMMLCLCSSGQDVQRASVIVNLPNLVRQNPAETFRRVVPKVRVWKSDPTAFHSSLPWQSGHDPLLWWSLLAVSQGDQRLLCSLTGSVARSRGGHAARRSRLFPHRPSGRHRSHPDAHTLDPADRPPQLRPSGHRSGTVHFFNCYSYTKINNSNKQFFYVIHII